jgi:hypothetical protein
MNRDDTHLEELKALSRQWRARIDKLEAQVDEIEGPEQIATVELLTHLKQQQTIVDQYLELAQHRGDDVFEKEVGAVQNMFQDIDDTYRRALVYFD